MSYEPKSTGHFTFFHFLTCCIPIFTIKKRVFCMCLGMIKYFSVCVTMWHSFAGVFVFSPFAKKFFVPSCDVFFWKMTDFLPPSSINIRYSGWPLAKITQTKCGQGSKRQKTANKFGNWQSVKQKLKRHDFGWPWFLPSFLSVAIQKKTTTSPNQL